MNPIRTNKPVFFGDDGDPLKSGKIYIGQPDQWPIDFPKTVTFQDSAGSQFTAQQPLTTNADGRITYNGKAIIALVDGSYSILVRDRNGVAVGEGYTPFVENAVTGGADTEGVTRVGLLLSDIKQFDVTPGQTARNVGKLTTLDGLGSDWLVVSNTGSPADDVDLINFANGTQGKRTYSNAYPAAPRQVWSGSSTAVNTSLLSESGPGIYILETSEGTYSFAVQDTAKQASGASMALPLGVVDDLEVIYSRYTGDPDNNFQVERASVKSASPSQDTLIAIYKV